MTSFHQAALSPFCIPRCRNRTGCLGLSSGIGCLSLRDPRLLCASVQNLPASVFARPLSLRCPRRCRGEGKRRSCPSCAAQPCLSSHARVASVSSRHPLSRGVALAGRLHRPFLSRCRAVSPAGLAPGPDSKLPALEPFGARLVPYSSSSHGKLQRSRGPVNSCARPGANCSDGIGLSVCVAMTSGFPVSGTQIPAGPSGSVSVVCGVT